MSDPEALSFTAGDLVRIRPAGQSRFVVQEIDEEGHAVIAAEQDAPGRYPFPMPVTALIPAASGMTENR